MNEDQLTIVKKYKIHKLLNQKIDFLTGSCIREDHNKCFHTNKYKCAFDIKLTNISNIERIN